MASPKRLANGLLPGDWPCTTCTSFDVRPRWLFTSREHHPLNRNYINAHLWKPALRRAGVEPTRDNGMHTLRHHFASVLIDAGESAKAITEYLGHADPGFTLCAYAHLFPASEDRARRALDSAFSSAADSLRTGTAAKR